MILKLRLKNFRQHKDTTLHLTGRGSVGLIGANATGKSTIIEAIGWGFYGAKAARGTKGSLRWSRAAARNVAEVHIDFEHAGHTYLLIRKETSAELFENGSDTPRASGTEAVSAEIANIFGMNLEEFLTTHFCTQEDLARLGKMGETDRTKFVLRVMQVDQVDRAIDQGRIRKNALATEKRGLLAGLGDREPLDMELTAAAETLILAEDRERDAKAAAGAVRVAESVAVRTHAKMDTDRADYDRFSDQERRSVEKTVELAAEILNLDRQAERAAAGRIRIDEARPRLSQIPLLRAERDRLLAAETQANRRAGLEEEIAKATSALERLRTQEQDLASRIASHDPAALDRADAHSRAATETARALRQARETAHAVALAAGKAASDQIDKAKRKLAVLRDQGPAGACPTCERALGEHYETAIEELAQDLAEAQAEREVQLAAYRASLNSSSDETETEAAAKAAEAALTACRGASEEIGRVRDNLKNVREAIEEKATELTRRQAEQALIGTLDASPQRRQQIDVELEALRDLEQTVAADRAAIVQADETAPKRLEILGNRKAQESLTEAARKALAQISFDPEKMEAATAALDAARAESQAKMQTLARVQAELTAARQRLNRADHAVLDYDRKAERTHLLTKQIKLLEETVEALIAFRTEQVEAIRPELEERTAHYVDVLTDGRYPDITMDESFAVRLIDGDTEMEVISGGSKDIAALAIRLALGEMIAERSGKPLTLLVLDEPFAALAQEWRANVISLIENLKDRFEQTILITHHTEVRQGVDQAFTLAYDQADGFSRVEDQSNDLDRRAA